MASPAHEMSRECANLLVVAAESGDAVSEAGLQEELGVGHDDLSRILEQLRENGQAVEVAPGEWSGPSALPEEAAPRVEVEVPDGEPEDELSRRRPVPERVMGSLMPQPTVRLTRSIAEALDSDALGKLVLAGVADCGDGETFVMEIAP